MRVRFSLPVALLIAGPTAPTFAEEAPPVLVTVDMEGKEWGDESCEGGDWALSWSGPVAVERGPLSDLLRSYTAFDTSQDEQDEIRPANFRGRGVRCRDNDGNITLRSKISGASSSAVHLNVSLAPDAGVDSPSFSFSVDELGSCSVESSGPTLEYPLFVGYTTIGPNSMTPALQITQQELEQGFDKSYQFDGVVTGIVPPCLGNELARGTIRMRYKRGDEDPAVSLDACLHLAKDEVRPITAQGTPEGGRYSFTTTGVAFGLRDQRGNAANVLGQQPGKGEVNVWYEHAGRAASATVAGSVVDVISINGGAAIPKLGLFGTNGLRIDGTRDFSLRLDPVDGVVQMTLENETLASVVNTSSKVQLQPTKIGETFMQAKTLCGTTLGPRVRIEIVRCDEDVKRDLRRQQQEIKSQIDQLVKRITAMLAGKDFQEAATQIDGSTKDLAIKTAESIIGTLAFKDAKQLEALKKGGKVLGKEVLVNSQRLAWVQGTYTIGDVMNDMGEAVDSNDWQKELKPFLSIAVELARNEAIALGKTYGEAYLAAEKFGTQLGTLAGVAEQLENLEPQLDRLVKELIRISTRLEYCEDKTPPPPPPPPPPKEEPTPIPIETGEPVEIPVPEEPVPEEKKDDDPPPQEEGKKIYGLACRVQDLRAPGVAQRLGALRQHVLAERTSQPAPSEPTATEAFAKASIDTALTRATELDALRDYTRDLKALSQFAQSQQRQVQGAQGVLQTWRAAIDRMAGAMNGSDAEGLEAARAFHSATQDFAVKSAEYGYSSVETLAETDECRDRLQVKVDQVRARYN